MIENINTARSEIVNRSKVMSGGLHLSTVSHTSHHPPLPSKDSPDTYNPLDGTNERNVESSVVLGATFYSHVKLGHGAPWREGGAK